MKVPTTSRRAIVGSSALLSGAGLVGAVRYSQRTAQDGPGARSFSAGTVPADIDRLVHVRVSELDDSAARAATDSLLDAIAFEDVPDAFAALVGGKSATNVDPTGLRKLVLCGDEADGTAALAWVAWDEADLVAELEAAGDVEAEKDTDGAHRLGESAVVSLDEDAFAVGAPAATDAIGDVWHGDGEALTGDLLRVFEWTTTDAPVRFAFADPGTGCDGAVAADGVTHTFGSARTAADEWIVEAGLWAESLDTAATLEEEVAADFGLAERSDGAEPIASGELRQYLSLDREGRVVELRYRSPATESPGLVAAFLDTLGCSLRS